MIAQPQTLTVEEFEAFALRPENLQRRLEFIEGRIVELVSNDVSSEVAASFLIEVGAFAKAHKLGRVTGADGGYVVGTHRYIPDAAFISFQRQAGPSGQAYNPIAPDLAVEVLSPSDDMSEVRIKIANYVYVGTTVWLVDPIKQQVEVYAPNAAPKVIGIDGVLDGGAALPGFTLAMRDIFGG